MIPDLAGVAARFGTPTYLYDRADVRRGYAALRRALPDPSVVYYSVKANPHPDLAGALARAGSRAEVSSVGEVEAAVAAGFAPADILMTGPGKSASDLASALAAGVRRFSVDSPVDLARLGDLAERWGAVVSCLLRVNADDAVPGMGLSMTGTASAFGADASWVLREPERFVGHAGARVVGLHLYMGTNIGELETLLAQFETSVRLARRLRDALGVPFQEVDLGGGFGAPYARSGDRPLFDRLAARLEPTLDEQLPGWRERRPLLAFESGRYLMGGCGWLIAGVVDVKVSKNRTFVVLDSGINHLGGMSGLRRVPRIVPDLLLGPDGTERPPVEDCAVVGPLCTPLDAWSQGVTLPRLDPGDVVAVPTVGAYGLTAGLLAFLGHRPPLEVVVDSDDADAAGGRGLGAPVSVSRLALVRGFEAGNAAA
ncbi:MAG: type III PLP-dependent enzyme, partial [Frankia sp.]